MQIKKAIILSAGFGKRLIPITLSKPKPLFEINKKKFIGKYNLCFRKIWNRRNCD